MMEVEMVEWKGFLALSALHFLLAYLFFWLSLLFVTSGWPDSESFVFGGVGSVTVWTVFTLA